MPTISTFYGILVVQRAEVAIELARMSSAITVKAK